MSPKQIVNESDLRAEMHSRLAQSGIAEDLIKDDVLLSRGFWADIVVLDKLSRQPLMAFELKTYRGGYSAKPPYHLGCFAEKIPYYLLVYNLKEGTGWIARIKSEKVLSESVEWSDEEEVCKLLSIDYTVARKFAKWMNVAIEKLSNMKTCAKWTLRLWFPLILLVSLVVHIGFKPLTWELVAYYGILTVVAFVGSGIQIHLKYKDIEALIGEWQTGADVAICDRKEICQEGGRHG